MFYLLYKTDRVASCKKYGTDVKFGSAADDHLML